MITFPQSFEESSSSDLSDLSDLSDFESLPTPKALDMAIPIQALPSSEKSRASTLSAVTRRRSQRKLTQRRRSKSTTLPRTSDESSSDEDIPAASRTLLIHAAQKFKPINRYSQRKTSRPESYRELSSSEISEPGSPLTEQEPSSDELSDSESVSTMSESSSASPMQDMSWPAEKTPNPISHNQASSARNEEWIQEHSKQSPHNFQVKTVQKQSAKSSFSSSIDAPYILSHRLTTHGQTQATQQNHPRNQQPELMEMSMTSAPADTSSLPTSSQGDFIQGSFFVPQALSSVQGQFCMPQQSNSSQQNRFCIPETGQFTQEQHLWNQQKPTTSDFSNIDPIFLGFGSEGTGTFNQYCSLPANPALLDIGEPLQFPVWALRDFRPVCSCGEEPSELALSDYEGDIDVPNSPPHASGGRLVKEVGSNKHVYPVRGRDERKRRLLFRRRNRISNRSRKPSRGHRIVQAQGARRGTQPASGTVPTDEQKRFIILLHSYWGMNFGEITQALNREFENGDEDEPWSIKRTKESFAAARCEPRFEEYTNILIDANVGTHEPVGLSEDFLREAKGFLSRLKQD